MTNEKKVSTVKIDSTNPEVKTIEQKNDERFLNKKNGIIIGIAFAISIALIVLTFLFVLKIDWVPMFKAMSNGFATGMGYLWFFLLIVYTGTAVLANFLTLYLRLRKLGYKIPGYQYFLFGITISFLRATTPLNLVFDPYTLYWMRTQGVPMSKASSVMLSNTLLWQISHIIVAMPSFILCMANWSLLSDSAAGLFTLSMIIIGIGTDVLGFIWWFIFGMSKTIHVWISNIFNWIKKKLHMHYHTKCEIVKKYKENATIRRDFINFFKDWKTTLLIVVCFAVFVDLFVFFSIGWSMLFVQNVVYQGQVVKVQFSYLETFNCASAAYTANKVNFMPGGELGLPFFITFLLQKLGGWKDIPGITNPNTVAEIRTQVSTNAVLIWRTMGVYLPAIVGLGGIIGLTTQQLKTFKNKKAQ